MSELFDKDHGLYAHGADDEANRSTAVFNHTRLRLEAVHCRGDGAPESGAKVEPWRLQLAGQVRRCRVAVHLKHEEVNCSSKRECNVLLNPRTFIAPKTLKLGHALCLNKSK